MSIVGLLHPGEMGAAVGQCLLSRGHTVRWASPGRSPATAARAGGFDDVGSVAEVAARADVILSICPPHAALDVARDVAGFGGLYVDANAVSPATAREAAAIIEDGGGTFVDGGIIGGPPGESGPGPRLYVSGDAAEALLPLKQWGIDLRPIPGGIGAASALKMSYAGITKGLIALGSAMALGASQSGAAAALRAELASSQPDILRMLDRGVPGIHFYCLNRVPSCSQVLHNLGLAKDGEGVD